MKLGQLEFLKFLTFFPIENFLFLLPKVSKIVCLDRIQNSHSFYKKKL